MNENSLFVLIHSPLVGSLTWSLVAEQMRQRGLSVIVPTLINSPNSKQPFWKQHAKSVSKALGEVSKDTSLTLVAHSGAGPLLPVIRRTLVQPISTYMFVDAGIPRGGATRLDLMKTEDPEWAEEFEESLKRGERFPSWSMDDLKRSSRIKNFASK